MKRPRSFELKKDTIKFFYEVDSYWKKHLKSPLAWVEAKDININYSKSAQHFLLEPIEEIKYTN